MRASLLGMVGVVVVVAMGSARGNLVTDPGFEGSGGGSWNPYSSHANFLLDFDYTASSENIWEGMESFAVTWSALIPQWNIVEARQDYAVTEGQDWYASAWVKAAASLNGAQAYIETIFYDIAMGEVGKLTSSSLTDLTDWTRLETSGTVSDEATTARLRLLVFTSGGDSSSGSVFFDDVYAAIPEPATASLIAIAGLGLMLARRRRARA